MTSLTPAPSQPDIDRHVEGLLQAADRCARSLGDAFEELIEDGVSYPEAAAWQARSIQIRRGLLLQKAVATAFLCDGRFSIREDVTLRLKRPVAGQQSVKVDLLLHDLRTDRVAACEVTRTTRSRSPLVWANRTRLLGALLDHHAERLPGKPDEPPVIILTAEERPALTAPTGARVLSIWHLGWALDVPVGWAVKATDRQFQAALDRELDDGD